MVTPIFKSGGRSNPSNYRPVSSLPIISKVFEINMKNQLLQHLESNNHLSTRQFGYRQHHSCEQFLQSILQEWRTNLDFPHPCYISALSLDVRKAFDSINHQILLNKLPKFNISQHAVKLLSSYLSGRSQIMKVNNVQSQVMPIHSGVPQGSILGPILFNMAVNDLLSTSSSIYAYADDTVIFSISSTAEESISKCTKLLTTVNNWYCQNRLQLNIAKSQLAILSNRQDSCTHSLAVDTTPLHSLNFI